MTDVIDLFRSKPMSATITLGALANPDFTATMQELLNKKLPVKTAYKIKGLVDKFNGELKKFSDLRKETLDRLCDKKEDGSIDVDEHGNYKFAPEKLAEVSKEISDLASIEVEFEALSIDALGDIDITTQQLIVLGTVIQG